jgi:predicted nucleic acid-binding protein
MNEVCVDASFLLAYLLSEAHSEKAASQWRGWTSGAARIVSAPLFHAEVTSAVRKRVKAEEMSADAGRDIVRRSLRWPIDLWQDVSLLQMRAWEWATRYNQRKAYDEQYLAVAELLGCELWTADERLYNRVRKDLPWVRWVGEPA